MRKKEHRLRCSLIVRKLLIFSLASCFRLLLALYAGLLIMLSLAKLGKCAVTCSSSLKATECAVQRLAFLYSDLCHFCFPSLRILPEQSKSLLLYNIFFCLSIVFFFLLMFFSKKATILSFRRAPRSKNPRKVRPLRPSRRTQSRLSRILFCHSPPPRAQ